MFRDKRVEKAIVSKQSVLAIGNQQRRFNLRGVGVKFAALVVEQSVHWRDADAQQRKEGHVKLGDIAQLHQRGLPRFSPWRCSEQARLSTSWLNWR